MDKKRKDYIKWNDFFMLSAKLASERSKDPNTQVGAVIVNNENRIVSSGYNGFCNGISDDEFSWGKNSENPLLNKYFYVCHAELNAILNCAHKPKGCTIYCTLFCCNECAKAIIQSGIKKVVFANEPDKMKDTYKASLKMFETAGVKVEKYKGIKEFKINV